MTLTLSLSPAFQLARDGTPVPLKNKKAQALLVYLALTGKPQSREHLATLLWGDRFDEQARNSLRQALFALRKAVGDGVVEGEDALSVRDGSLIVDNGTGGILDGFLTGAQGFDTWLAETRERMSHGEAERAQAEAERLKEAGRTAEALTQAERALALEPLSEPALRLTMTLLAAEGRRAEALSLFHRFEARLKAELDAQPDAFSRHSFNLLKQDEQEHFTVDAPKDSVLKGKILVANFEDLGGGEIATFIARELPIQISSDLSKLGYLGSVHFEFDHTTEMAEPSGMARKIADEGAGALVTGSARQIGDRVRVSMRGYSATQGLLFNEITVITADEAFDFIPAATDRLRNGLLVLWRQLVHVRQSEDAVRPLDQLRDMTGNPDRFRALFSDLWMAAFYSAHTRQTLAAMDEACDFAITEFPREAHYLVAKGMVTHHIAQLADTKDRVAGFRAALAFVTRARALEPGLYTAIHIGMIPANWLGHFDDVREGYRILSQPGTKVGSLDGLLALSHLFSGYYAQAIEDMQSTIAQETGYPVLMYRYGGLGLAQFLQGEQQAALDTARAALEISGEFWLPHLVSIAALERLGRHDDAIEALAAMRKFHNDPRVSDWDWLPFTTPEPKTQLLDALRDAGMPD